MRFWSIGIPKKTLMDLLDQLDADADGFITIGEVRDLLKRYGKDAKSSGKETIMRRRLRCRRVRTPSSRRPSVTGWRRT